MQCQLLFAKQATVLDATHPRPSLSAPLSRKPAGKLRAATKLLVSLLVRAICSSREGKHKCRLQRWGSRAMGQQSNGSAEFLHLVQPSYGAAHRRRRRTQQMPLHVQSPADLGSTPEAGPYS